MLEGDITTTLISPEGTSTEEVTPDEGHEEWKRKQVEAYRKLQSDKDALIAAERTARQTTEAERDEWQSKYELEVSRRTVAESKATDAEQMVNLRNAARSWAAAIRAAWGDEAGVAAESKLLEAQDPRHLTVLYQEFMMSDLPQMQKKQEGGQVTQQRLERAQAGIEGITIASLPPTAAEGSAGDVLTRLLRGVTKARQNRLWKDSPEAQELLREAETALGRKFRDFGQLNLTLQRVVKTQAVAAEKKQSKV